MFTNKKKRKIEGIRQEILGELAGDVSDENVEKVLTKYGDPLLLAIRNYSIKKMIVGTNLFDVFLYFIFKYLQIVGLLYLLFLFVRTISKIYYFNLDIKTYINLVSSSFFMIFEFCIILLVMWLFFLLIVEMIGFDQKLKNKFESSRSKWVVSYLKGLPTVETFQTKNIVLNIIWIPVTILIAHYILHLKVPMNHEAKLNLFDPEIVPFLFKLFIIHSLLRLSQYFIKLIIKKWNLSLALYVYFIDAVNFSLIIYVIFHLKALTNLNLILVEWFAFYPEMSIIYIVVLICILSFFDQTFALFKRIRVM